MKTVFILLALAIAPIFSNFSYGAELTAASRFEICSRYSDPRHTPNEVRVGDWLVMSGPSPKVESRPVEWVLGEVGYDEYFEPSTVIELTRSFEKEIVVQVRLVRRDEIGNATFEFENNPWVLSMVWSHIHPAQELRNQGVAICRLIP